MDPNVSSSGGIESNRVRLNHKSNLEYGGIKIDANQKNLGQTKEASTSVGDVRNLSTSAITERLSENLPRRPWKNYRVINGHLGCVRSVSFDPSNQWFCTGSADHTIKVWDVATGYLKVTLTGHIGQVRGVSVSKHHTYLLSAGDDQTVKCWDLERNMVIRSFHGHLSGVYCLAHHPNIDILFTGGRDSVCRVWDIRRNGEIFSLPHNDTVCSVLARVKDPQVITGSYDTTVKLWDVRKRETMSTLVHHKRSVRAMTHHPSGMSEAFVSASGENIKKFKLPRGEFMQNMVCEPKSIVNAMAVNKDGVLATGGDNGNLWFRDWNSGQSFQQCQSVVQPGSLDCEAGIYALQYDITGTRLVSCEADKTIKMWKEDENAPPQTRSQLRASK